VVSWSSFVIAKTSSISAGRPRALALAALVALGLSGCGRIGPLEPPPEANAPPKPAPTAEESALSPQVKPKIPPITAPQQPFILDPLLK
jgi:predicted small lipoprotein YifL